MGQAHNQHTPHNQPKAALVNFLKDKHHRHSLLLYMQRGWVWDETTTGSLRTSSGRLHQL